MNKHLIAIEYAKKALKNNSKNGFAYGTLAESYAMISDDENFYKNVELALQFGFPVWEQLDEVKCEKYIKQVRYQELIKKFKK